MVYTTDRMHKISRAIIKAIKNDKKILIFGCGGLASESNHFAGELVGKFKKDRRALPAISLTSNEAIITAVANDYSFDHVFVRQLEALGRKGDVAIGMSTSGKSQSVLNALEWAKKHHLIAVDLPRTGIDTPTIQENQLKLIHRISEEVEDAFV